MTKRGKGRGGKRAGAGRKSNQRGGAREGAGRPSIPELHDLKNAAANILRAVDGTPEETAAEWKKLLQHKSPGIRLKAREILSKLAYPVAKPTEGPATGVVTIIIRPSEKTPLAKV